LRSEGQAATELPPARRGGQTIQELGRNDSSAKPSSALGLGAWDPQQLLKALNATLVLDRLQRARCLDAAIFCCSAWHLQDQDRINPRASYKELNEQPFMPVEGAAHRTDSDDQR
jgi:hypothetical protein